ncbi:MAG: hypothetical protein ACYTGH_20200, partial [Planctomycetota bacterium]
KSGAPSGLLYEPGNWGDILKAAFALRIAHWLLERGGADAFSCLDAFAGAPGYEITPDCRGRLSRLSTLDAAAVWDPFVVEGIWPSTASLLGEGLNKDLDGPIQVFDADPDRLDGYGSLPGFEPVATTCGYGLACSASVQPLGLVLVDPYDFLKDWQRELPRLIERTRAVSVLIYIFNRAGKSSKALAEYRAFRNAFKDCWMDRPRLLGRVAADPFLPQTFHEMLFLPGEAVQGEQALQNLFDRLEEDTEEINRVLSLQSMIERG